MKRASLVVAFILFYAPAHASQTLWSLQGKWTGQYTCGQGRTNLDLVVNLVDGQYTGIFSFKVPNGPSGSFNIATPPRVRLSNSVKLVPGTWIKQPGGYYTVAMNGSISSNGLVYQGRIEAPHCSTFRVTRNVAIPLEPNAGLIAQMPTAPGETTQPTTVPLPRPTMNTQPPAKQSGPAQVAGNVDKRIAQKTDKYSPAPDMAARTLERDPQQTIGIYAKEFMHVNAKNATAEDLLRLIDEAFKIVGKSDAKIETLPIHRPSQFRERNFYDGYRFVSPHPIEVRKCSGNHIFIDIASPYLLHNLDRAFRQDPNLAYYLLFDYAKCLINRSNPQAVQAFPVRYLGREPLYELPVTIAASARKYVDYEFGIQASFSNPRPHVELTSDKTLAELQRLYDLYWKWKLDNAVTQDELIKALMAAAHLHGDIGYLAAHVVYALKTLKRDYHPNVYMFAAALLGNGQARYTVGRWVDSAISAPSTDPNAKVRLAAFRDYLKAVASVQQGAIPQFHWQQEHIRLMYERIKNRGNQRPRIEDIAPLEGNVSYMKPEAAPQLDEVRRATEGWLDEDCSRHEVHLGYLRKGAFNNWVVNQVVGEKRNLGHLYFHSGTVKRSGNRCVLEAQLQTIPLSLWSYRKVGEGDAWCTKTGERTFICNYTAGSRAPFSDTFLEVARGSFIHEGLARKIFDNWADYTRMNIRGTFVEEKVGEQKYQWRATQVTMQSQR